MSTPIRGYVWFCVSSIEDDAETVGIQTYVLKKTILVALKCDHLSDLKLADSNFRTPACIDLLLGNEVFMSLLHDGRQTGPQVHHSQLILALDGCSLVRLRNFRAGGTGVAGTAMAVPLFSDRVLS